jgi:hypothetical protein
MSGTAIFSGRRLALWRTLTTPQRLLRSLAMIVLLCALTAGSCLWAAASIGDAARTIGLDAEPSVALGSKLSATLGDLDATALADALTDGGSAIGTSRRYREDVDQVDADLIEASRNITYGEREAGPLRELVRFLALYEEAVTEARFRSQGDAWLTSRRMQWASRVNQLMAKPQAQALAQANADELERHYAAYRQSSVALGLVSAASFLLLLAVLLGVQIRLAQRTRRLFNPLLAGATAVALAGGIWFVSAVAGERADLRAAKFDAYDSLHVLFAAKSVADEIRADMSLWLLDPDARRDAQARIATAMRELFGTDLSRPTQVIEPLKRAQDLEKSGQPERAAAATPHFGGLLGTELNNVTFGVAERAAATQIVIALVSAERAMTRIQSQEQQGAHREAITTWLSQDRGGGAHEFNSLQSELDRTIAVNQAAFDQYVSSALAGVRQMPWVACGTMGLTALLAAGGLWLRLREYR